MQQILPLLTCDPAAAVEGPSLLPQTPLCPPLREGMSPFCLRGFPRASEKQPRRGDRVVNAHWGNSQMMDKGAGG